MKVILQRDVPKVGKGGDVVNLKDGYARNYLFPRGYAVPATGGALKELEARVTREQQRDAKMVDKATADAGKVDGKTLIILAKVGSGSRLYGSVTAQDVADTIAKDCGVTVDKRRVGLVDPIKALGTYPVPVRLHSDVTAQVVVDVTTAEELERRKIREAEEAAKAAAEAAKAAEAETPTEAAPAGEAPAAE